MHHKPFLTHTWARVTTLTASDDTVTTLTASDDTVTTLTASDDTVTTLTASDDTVTNLTASDDTVTTLTASDDTQMSRYSRAETCTCICKNKQISLSSSLITLSSHLILWFCLTNYKYRPVRCSVCPCKGEWRWRGVSEASGQEQRSENKPKIHVESQCGDAGSLALSAAATQFWQVYLGLQAVCGTAPQTCNEQLLNTAVQLPLHLYHRKEERQKGRKDGEEESRG
ncbi:hypothetical protein JZ751_008527 [Albula glossodonta]|uniref:Uncharacterized protein n=1 Tax=Albula glossodonta TaxID=121402 RepID=A0A8T2N8R3_9TELE|nr:hypothetical protein JZ751_008527 [Albula glossodonta]